MLLADSNVAMARMEQSPSYSDKAAVRALLDKLLGESGFDAAAPLVNPGDSVVIKPNWVMHKNASGAGLDCLVANASVVGAVLEHVLKYSPRKVIVGDAPVQGCNFEQLMKDGGFDELREQYRNTGVPVEWIDFRRTTLNRDKAVWKQSTDLREMDRYTLFDLGEQSLLEPISKASDRFRVTVYNPDLMRQRHSPGKHQYLVAKEVLEADVVINLPKLKTHAKAGITAALKNLVGINGNKEFLPHHCAGGSENGGDCYPGGSKLKLAAEYFLDEANRRSGAANAAIRQFSRVSFKLARMMGEDGNLEGSWYGNDTIWRTCLDLNRILKYGRADGHLQKTQQRRVVTITDAIICGQGNGPLAPTPMPLGVLTCAVNPAAADYVHAHVMGFDWTKVPLVRKAFSEFHCALADFPPQEIEILFDGKRLKQPWPEWTPVPFEPPVGWKGHCERVPRQQTELLSVT